jgi:hypothetical protein
MYHTQEKRDTLLVGPVQSPLSSSWLGKAYYYWYDGQDAFNWGITHKTDTGYFEIYESDIDCTDVLDTVFNEKHYLFWMKEIEKIAKTIVKRTGRKPATKYINEYFRDHGIWNSVTGIMFQDIPKNNEYVMVIGFYYKKRIQLAVYDLRIVQTFTLKSTEKCV